MTIPTLYIIGGCNGAGKTTASMTFLPQLVKCKEFVNADEIARGLNPLNPEEMAVAAGRIMLERIDELLSSRESFAIETTLATKSYRNLIEDAKSRGYAVVLIFIFLSSPELAVERVRLRVESGGHSIPEEVIRRRYVAGLRNLILIYMPLVSHWLLIDNTMGDSKMVATDESILDKVKFEEIMIKSHG